MTAVAFVLNYTWAAFGYMKTRTAGRTDVISGGADFPSLQQFNRNKALFIDVG